MKQAFSSHNDLDAGIPAGGTARATGIDIRWQNGPLGRDPDRKPPNGAFVETVIAIALDRLQFYQGTRFNCRENALAITKLEEALHWLDSRTRRREEAGVEGTHDGK